jgi:hypothetical protein
LPPSFAIGRRPLQKTFRYAVFLHRFLARLDFDSVTRDRADDASAETPNSQVKS